MDKVIGSNPQVSVLMPVYNAGKYVGEAIESILNQTFSNFEFLIFNDGSSDNSLKIINSYNDKRVKVFHYDINQGHLVHLIQGIEIASGEFIARMDADDISMPDRLLKQVDFLRNNPDVGVCGSWIKSFEGRNQIIKFPESDDEIKVSLLSHNSFAHPVVMIRKSVLKNNNITYCKEFYTSQDYKMWADLVPFTKFYNLPQVLLKYRITKNQISGKFNHLQYELSKRIWISQLRYIGIAPSETETRLHINMINNKISDVNDLSRIDSWLNTLKEANNKNRFYNQSIFSHFIAKLKYNSLRVYVYNKYYLNKSKNLDLVRTMIFSEYRFYRYLTLSQKIKFIGKLILKK